MNTALTINNNINYTYTNIKTYKNPCFKSNSFIAEVKESLAGLSPEERMSVLKEVSGKLGISISSLISFFSFEKSILIKTTSKLANLPKVVIEPNLKKEKDNLISYKKDNVTFYEYWYDASNRCNIAIDEKEQNLIFEFIDKKISKNPKFNNLDIIISIHMPKGKVFLRYKQKDTKDSNDYKFIEGKYNNGNISINLDSIL